MSTRADQALRKVQQRVAAIGFFAVAIHGILGTVAASHIVDSEGRRGAAIAFLALSAVIGLLTCAGVRLILQRSLWAPAWIALSLLPAAAGAAWLVR